MARRKADVLPIRIREHLVVQVVGLPHDLTAAEARKIADVVVALGTVQPVAALPMDPREIDETGDWLPNVRRVAE